MQEVSRSEARGVESESVEVVGVFGHRDRGQGVSACSSDPLELQLLCSCRCVHWQLMPGRPRMHSPIIITLTHLYGHKAPL